MFLLFVYFLTVSLEDQLQYLKMYSTDHRQIFNTGSAVGEHDQSDIFPIAQGRCYSNQFCDQQAKIDRTHVHSSHLHSTTDWNIVKLTPLKQIEIW